MEKHIPRSFALPILLLTLAAAAVPPAAAQSDPGRYRSQGQYRPEGQYRAPQPPMTFQNPWSPMQYSQKKYYQVLPPGQLPGQIFTGSLLPSQQAPFTGDLSRSNLPRHGGGFGFNVIVPMPVLPIAGVYEPDVYQREPPPPPPPAPAPQIYFVQPPPPSAAPPPYEPPPPAPPVSTEPGELALDVRPADAQIFLNDRLVGTGESLAAKGVPLRLRAGVYVLEARHPDFEPQRLVFGVNAEQTVRVAVDLTANQPGRRARLVKDDADFLLN